MSNSIFDDDDGAFSLSSGFDGGEAPKAPKVTPPKDRPAVGQPQTRINRPVTPPNKQSAPVRPGMPVKGGATSVRRQEQQANTPASSLPKPPGSSASPDTGRSTKLPAMPPLRSTGSSSLPSAPKSSTPKPSLPVVPVVEEFQEEHYVDEEMPKTQSRQYAAPEYEEPAASSYAETAVNNLREQDDEDYVDYEQERRDRERRREREIARQREEEQRDAQRQREDYERLMAEERRRNAPKEEEQDDSGSSKTETKNTKKKSRSKGKKEKPVKESKYAGGRKQVLWLQIVVYTVLGVMVLAGAKATFLPSSGPTPDQVISVVKKGIGMTDFPTEKAEGFVISFSDAYLTLNDGGVSERNKVLSLYMPTGVIQEQGFQQSGPATQTVTGGPYINSVKSVDDNNAIYTVSAQVNDGIWLYMDVPAYYDSENDSFAISGTPAFVPAPEQAAVPAQPRSWTADDKDVVEAFTPNAEIFFDAWSKSDKKAMNPFLTEDANTTAKAGLNGTAKFIRLANVHVEPAPETADVSNRENRQARVTVVWENPFVAKTTYQQTYDITLKKVADQWRIQSIDGGVPTETGAETKE